MSLQISCDKNERLLGRVKWFNNKAGYGFITITDGTLSGTDVFVHHSSIKLQSEQQYRYLVQGEYVEFSVCKIEGGKHEFQSSNVTGIKSGKLMCETRREIKIAVNNYKSALPEKEVEGDKTKQNRRPRKQGEFKKSMENEGWTRVNK